MKVGIFSEAFNLNGQSIENKFSRVGRNTGNLVFFRAIDKLFHPDFISPYYGIHNERERIEAYDAFLTTDLIWINENAQYKNTEKILKNIGHRPLIPVSVGLQSRVYKSDFYLHPLTVRLLSRIAERCVIGVRGEYTAEILEKYGIRNLEVIGCPSVYYENQYHMNKKESRTDVRVACSFKTFWGKCSPREIKFLDYCREHSFDFIEQTMQPMSRVFIRNCERFEEWLGESKHIFFDIEEWSRFMQQYDFYMGMRFHGGVLAMQSGIPALFIITDTRVRELTGFFGLPAIEAEDFKARMSVKRYYAKADYSQFYKKYEKNKQTMIGFARKNQLEINLQ